MRTLDEKVLNGKDRGGIDGRHVVPTLAQIHATNMS